MGKKVLLVLLVLIVVALVFGGGFLLGKRSFSNNDAVSIADAEKDEDHRNLTIVNDTDEIINELRICLEDGTEIYNETNPDARSILVPVDDAYRKYSIFVVEMKDNYGRLYKKEQNSVPETGRTSIKVTKDDRVKQDWDEIRDLSDWFNDAFGNKD